MLVIGVTGGVGCGKSLLLSELSKSFPARVLRTDELANEVKEPGGVCYNEIVSLLGEAVLEKDEERALTLPDGTRQYPIDRARMAALIFADEELLRQVNGILHPAVRQAVREALREEERKGEAKVFFIEAALLIEANYRAITDELWYVYAPEAVRRKRLKEGRGYDDARIDAICARQLSEEEFRAGTDFEIDNSGAAEAALTQMRTRLELLLSK